MATIIDTDVTPDLDIDEGDGEPDGSDETPSEETRTPTDEYRDVVMSLPDRMAEVERAAGAIEAAEQEHALRMSQLRAEHDTAKQSLTDALERHTELVARVLPKSFAPPASKPARAARRRGTPSGSADYAARMETRKRTLARNAAIRRFAAERSLAVPEKGSDFSPDLIAAFNQEGGYQG